MTRVRHRGFAAALVLCAASAARVHAQPDIEPTNDLPNPYRTVEGWAKLPEGRTWGSTSAVEIDMDGVSIWVAERCQANSCLHSDLDPIMKFDSTGKLVRSFGAGMLIFPHGIHVDRDGNIWVTDGQDNAPQPARGTGAAGTATTTAGGGTAPGSGDQRGAAPAGAGAAGGGRMGPLPG